MSVVIEREREREREGGPQVVVVVVEVVRFKGGWLYRAGVGSRRNRLRWGQKRKVSRWPQGMSLNIRKKMNDSPLAAWWEEGKDRVV